MVIVSTKDNIMRIIFMYYLELGLVIVTVIVHHHLHQHATQRVMQTNNKLPDML